MTLLNPEELVASQALGNTSCEGLAKTRATKAKSDLPESKSKHVKFTLEIEATVAKGDPPSERPNTSCLGSDADLRILSKAVEEVKAMTKRGSDGKFQDNKEAAKVLDLLMDIIVSTKVEWSQRQVECGNDDKKRKELKNDFLLETGNAQVLMRFAELNKKLKTDMPKIQPSAPVRVTFQKVTVINSEAIRQFEGEATAEKDEG